MPAGNHGSCIHYLGLDICFDDSLQAHLIEGIGHWKIAVNTLSVAITYLKSRKFGEPQLESWNDILPCFFTVKLM